MFIYWLSNLRMGGGGSGVPLVVYIDPQAVRLNAAASDADIFGVDPRSPELRVDPTDPFSIDPRAVQLIET